VRACFCRARANGTTEKKDGMMGSNVGKKDVGSPFRRRRSDRLCIAESRFARGDDNTPGANPLSHDQKAIREGRSWFRGVCACHSGPADGHGERGNGVELRRFNKRFNVYVETVKKGRELTRGSVMRVSRGRRARCPCGSTFIFFTIRAGQTCKVCLGASI
jgi:hypothetical protein